MLVAACNARKGEGPSFLEAVCYRYEGHFSGDSLKYRAKDERAAWAERDPIVNFRHRLIAASILTSEDTDEMAKSAECSIDEALEFAKNSPFPDPATAYEDLYA